MRRPPPGTPRTGGVRGPKSAVFSRGADLAAITQAAETLGYPLFVKPVRAGSSFGVSRAAAPDQLPAAVEETFLTAGKAVLQESLPRSSWRASAEFRLALLEELTAQALRQAAAVAKEA